MGPQTQEGAHGGPVRALCRLFGHQGRPYVSPLTSVLPISAGPRRRDRPSPATGPRRRDRPARPARFSGAPASRERPALRTARPHGAPPRPVGPVAPGLSISEATVKTHLTHVFAKLGAKDRAAAVAVGYDRGIPG
ncbi:response regulator transcription factor [Streptomyces californicus]|uniref:response regulator transcription factor n=1 Tax=Streptomyces californicus TaxID=67351 RepID=UPI003682C867